MRSRKGLMGAAIMTAAMALATTAGAQGAEAFTFSVTAYKQAVAENLDRDASVAKFYRARGFEPIWTGNTDADRLRRQALLEAFEMADIHGLPRAKFSAQALRVRMQDASNGRSRGQLETELTQAFLDFAHALQSGVLEPDKVISGIKRQLPRRDSAMLLQRLMEGDPRAVLRDLIPSSPEYTRLMRAKLQLEQAVKTGGWGASLREAKLERGDSGARVVALRDRLTAMGYMAPSLSTQFDSQLEAAVREFQDNHGLEPDGVAGGSTIRQINIPARERLQSVMVAMERERWLNLPEGLGKRHVKVNLVDFHAQIYDDNKLTFETRSVIGHKDLDRRTPEFSDVMEYVVINPYWYVPRSIIVNEYLPLLRSNPGAAGHLDVIDHKGRVVGRGGGFSQYSARSFPYSMRQKPGPRNALGTVKFMFPNKYNIYLHDTPQKALFKREVRTFSHGCIRLNDPHDFAYEILAPQIADSKGYFKRTLASGQNTKVYLDQKVPVHLIYRTAFTTAKGRVQYRPDVYTRDARIWQALSKAGVEMRVGRDS